MPPQISQPVNGLMDTSGIFAYDDRRPPKEVAATDDDWGNDFYKDRFMAGRVDVKKNNGIFFRSAIWDASIGDKLHVKFECCMLSYLRVYGGKVTLIDSNVRHLQLVNSPTVILEGIHNTIVSVNDQGFGEIVGTTATAAPKEGEFIMYKSAWRNHKRVLVTLRVPASASRAWLFDIKVERAWVEKIEDDEGNTYDFAISDFDRNFVYKLGKIAVARRYNPNAASCTGGIHGFLNKDAARAYGLT